MSRHTGETKTRGSLLFDGAVGVTIPLNERWHIEPQVRGEYPHLLGLMVTAGYKFSPISKGLDKYTTKTLNGLIERN